MSVTTVVVTWYGLAAVPDPVSDWLTGEVNGHLRQW